MSLAHSRCSGSIRAPGLASGQARALVAFGEYRGLDLATCLRGCDIPATRFHQQNWEISLQQELQMIRNLLAALPETPAQLGFAASQMCKLSIYGLIGQSALFSANADEALGVISRYTARAPHFVRIISTRNGPQTRIVYELKVPVEESVGQFLIAWEMGLSIAVYRFMRNGRPLNLRAIGLSFPKAFRPEQLHCPIQINQNANYILVDNSALSVKMLFGDSDAAKLLEAHCYARMQPIPANEQALDQTLPSPLLARIHAELDKAECADLNRDQVAKRLNLSARSLSRHLQEEGSCWRELLSDYRVQRARHLLHGSNDSLEQIAEQVGYASASALSNAFQKHFGQSPARYRSDAHLNA